MERTLVFDQMYFDTKPIGHQAEISFFTETDENEESVTEMTESLAVKWLLQDRQFRDLFIGKFFEDPRDILAFLELREPFISQNKKPGDIDLLLVNPNKPNESVAFECKKVKAFAKDDNTSKVNGTGIDRIRKGVIQANAYQSLGFHRSYLMIIILDDVRNIKSQNLILRATGRDKFEGVFDIALNEALHEDVGIVYIRVSQMTGKQIGITGGLGVCIDKQGNRLEQSIYLTNKIKELIGSK